MIEDNYSPIQLPGNASTSTIYPVPDSWFENGSAARVYADGVEIDFARIEGEGITTLTPQSADVAITITRETELSQERDFLNNGTLPAEEVESMGDQLQKQIQEQAADFTRAPSFPIGQKPSDFRGTTLGIGPDGKLKARTAEEEVAHLGVGADQAIADAARESAIQAQLSAQSAAQSAVEAAQQSLPISSADFLLALQNLSEEDKVNVGFFLNLEDDLTRLPEAFAYWTQDNVSGVVATDQIGNRTLTSQATSTPIVGIRLSGNEASEQTSGDLLAIAPSVATDSFDMSNVSESSEVTIGFKMLEAEFIQLLRSSAFSQWRIAADNTIADGSRVRLFAMVNDGSSSVQTSRNIVTTFDTTGLEEVLFRFRIEESTLITSVNGVIVDTWTLPAGSTFDQPKWAQLGRHNTYNGRWELTRLFFEQDDLLTAVFTSEQFTAQVNNEVFSEQGTAKIDLVGIRSDTYTLGATVSSFDISQLLADDTNTSWVNAEAISAFFGGAGAAQLFDATNGATSQVLVSTNSSSQSFQILMLNAPATPAREAFIQGLLDGGAAPITNPDESWFGLNTGQSNSGGGGVTYANYPSLANLQAYTGIIDGTGDVVSGYQFDTFQNLAANFSGAPFNTTNQSAWQSAALAQGNWNNGQFGMAHYARGGRPIGFFHRDQGLGDLVEASLVNTKASLETLFPGTTGVLKYVYYDQVEFDGGNGALQDITEADYLARKATRARLVSEFIDQLRGNEAGNNFTVTNPNLIFYIRDIGDGQTNIGGGGPAASGTWNGWQAIRDAHQDIIDPTNQYYRPNVRLVNADGLVCGDGVHFSATQYNEITARFLALFNEDFGTNFTAVPST